MSSGVDYRGWRGGGGGGEGGQACCAQGIQVLLSSFFCSVMLLHVQIIGMWLLYDYSVHSI